MSCRCGTIANKAFLDFCLYGKKYVFESNEVEARKVCIKIIKEQNRNVVMAGDKICYTIKLINDSNIDLHDLDFRDRLVNDVEYERNSFRYNGECKNPTINGSNISYHIDELKAHCENVITFDVIVD